MQVVAYYTSRQITTKPPPLLPASISQGYINSSPMPKNLEKDQRQDKKRKTPFIFAVHAFFFVFSPSLAKTSRRLLNLGRWCGCGFGVALLVLTH